MIDIDFASLRLIGLNQSMASQLAGMDGPEGSNIALMRVTEVQRDWLQVHDGRESHPVRVRPGLLARLNDAEDQLAVGDWVCVQHNALGERWVDEVLAADTQLVRRANDGRRQVLASNIDTALLVMGLDADYNVRRLERYVVLALSSGVTPVVVLTKADLCADAEHRLEQVRQRVPEGIAAFAVNGMAAATADLLAPWLQAGQTLVLVGSSGAGKSTLTNTLLGHDVQLTGRVRDGDGRGRHTTTARSLHQCASGACIIDTPGIRTLQLDLNEEAVAATFTDIEALALQCRYRDCSHRNEPGCAVRNTVEAERLNTYHKLMREAARDKQTPLERKQEVATWKVRTRGTKLKMQLKRGQ
ncbi:MAG: ribosome small subunit-dependent GTPase A [Burkholderiales bacterium]|nr:ribosome small subunit-dependent GTPase A [Burkholderiales bacterium]